MKPNYGIDAPGLVRVFIITTIILLLIGSIFLYFSDLHSWAEWLAIFTFVLALYPLGMFCLMIWGSLVTKVADRELILNLIKWNGDENVLDVGCGRGLMVIGAARRLTTGHATGVDIWAAKDQSQNSDTAALDNAKIEGVANRITIKTADMRHLPFTDHSFDVVMSNWVVHNLDAINDRHKALAEMHRVLKPEGKILLTDIENCQEYLGALGTLGYNEVKLVIFSPLKDRVLKLVSFGSFAPSTIIASQKKV